jgi:hypothetical protein
MISVAALIVATLSQYDSSYLRGKQMHADKFFFLRPTPVELTSPQMNRLRTQQGKNLTGQAEEA